MATERRVQTRLDRADFQAVDDVNVYLATAEVAAATISRDAVREQWLEPSALDGMRVSGLAGHLARSIVLTEPFLDQEPAGGTPLSTAEYYVAGGDPADFDSRANRRVRETGEETAADGIGALQTAVHDSLERLQFRLHSEDLDAARTWFGNVVVTTRTVLQARILEMVVHVDDLAVSVGMPAPALPRSSLDLSIQLLLEIARRRHDDISVIRALTRHERDTVNALRVL